MRHVKRQNKASGLHHEPPLESPSPLATAGDAQLSMAAPVLAARDPLKFRTISLPSMPGGFRFLGDYVKKHRKSQQRHSPKEETLPHVKGIPDHDIMVEDVSAQGPCLLL